MGVQIQGDTGNVIATKGTYSGNVTIGGTLTYEDVTNIDSVGLVTARSGIEVGARPGVAASISVDGNMIVSGISTFGDDVKINVDSKKILLGAGADLEAFHNGTNSHLRTQTGDLIIDNNSGGAVRVRPKVGEEGVVCTTDGSTALYHDGTKKLETASGGVTVTGTVAATSFTGSGAALTGVGASNTSQVIEQILVPCDGTAAPTARGDMTIQNVTGAQIMTDSYVDVTGSTISYHPPTGTHTVIYSFQCAVANENSVDCIFYAKLIVDGNEVTYARNAYRNRYGQDLFKFHWPIKIGGSANTNTARLANWTAPKTLKIQGRRYDSGNPSRLHITDNWDGSTSEIFVMPVIGVTAIGTPS